MELCAFKIHCPGYQIVTFPYSFLCLKFQRFVFPQPHWLGLNIRAEIIFSCEDTCFANVSV